MGLASQLMLLLTHPIEFRTLLQYKIYYASERDITATQEHENSGWNRPTMQRCWHFLDLTSRSFAAVIKELPGDLARTIALFYLVLRALDTVEDDKTLDPNLKQEILRKFDVLTAQGNWTFEGSGPNEKDRIVLVEYDKIAQEVNLLPEGYRTVILDICQKMQSGMANYALTELTPSKVSAAPETIEEYDLYCHFVAGLVGEGLSRLFSASGKEAPWLALQLEMSNSMGTLLQKTNIIRDYREDCEEGRFFWPREIWGRVGGFKKIEEMCGMDPDTRRRAQHVQTAMVLDALRHATDALDYLRLLRNQNVFNFAAIPATMAMATLELCFMNPVMFERNIKIRKAQAASLIMRSTNPRDVAYIFRDYSRAMHSKADPSDPSFLAISVACGKIEQWCEHHYPSFVEISGGQGGGLSQQVNTDDPRAKIMVLLEKQDSALRTKIRMERIRANLPPSTSGSVSARNSSQGSMSELIMYLLAGLTLLAVLAGGIIWGVLKMSEEGGLLGPKL